jgi:hypothetical protein
LIDSLFALPQQPVIGADQNTLVCVGDSLQLSIQANSSETYQWYSGTAMIQGATDTIYYAQSNGDYAVRSTTINGCMILSEPYVVIYDDFPEYVNANGATTFCQGGEIDLSSSSGSNFLWSTGDTTQSIIVDSTGDYFLSFIDADGCPKVTDTVSITVQENPTVFLGNDSLLCSGASLTLDAGAGFNNYLWSTGSTGQTINVIPLGSFPDSINIRLFVVDSNGCSGSDTILVVFDICSGVKELVDPSKRLYPNPVSSNGLLHFSAGSEPSTLTIYDASGRSLFHKTLAGEADFYVTSILKPGIYSYRIDSKKLTEKGQIIIQ